MVIEGYSKSLEKVAITLLVPDFDVGVQRLHNSLRLCGRDIDDVEARIAEDQTPSKACDRFGEEWLVNSDDLPEASASPTP